MLIITASGMLREQNLTSASVHMRWWTRIKCICRSSTQSQWEWNEFLLLDCSQPMRDECEIEGQAQLELLSEIYIEFKTQIQ